MKFSKQKVVKTITEKDQEVFDKKCNEILKGMQDAQFHFNDAGTGILSVTIIGEKNITICESISEEYDERGDYHYCSECKFFELPKDKRVKYVSCGHDKASTTAGRRCCDFFYTMLEAGEEILK